MAPPMMQWPSHHYPTVSSITVNPTPYSPSSTVLPLGSKCVSTILAEPTTASPPATTSNSPHSTTNSDAAPSCAPYSFSVFSANLSTAFSCYKPQYHCPSNTLNSFNANAHHHWQSPSIERPFIPSAKQAHRFRFASRARRRAAGHQGSCCQEGRGGR